MGPRLRRTVTGSLLWLGSLVIIGLVFVEQTERQQWFLVWLPIAVVGAAVMDYVVWDHPRMQRRREHRAQRREELRNRPRYGE